MVEAKPANTMPGVTDANAPIIRSHKVVIALVLLGEIALTVASGMGQLGSIRLLILHLALVALMAVLLWRTIRTGDDGGASLLATIGTLATGPFGAAGALLLSTLSSQDATSADRLSAWYRRIALSAEQDEFTRLSDRVAIGRSANLAAPSPESLSALFQSGPIGDQQTALGMIARAFHPGYLPMLKMALDSPEPVIRVQAAAVAARIRAPLVAQVTAMLESAAQPLLPPADVIEIAANLDAACQSGLLEEKMRFKAAGMREALLARTYARFDADLHSDMAPIAHSVGADAIDAYGEHLLAQGRFDDFRALRRQVRLPFAGRYRRRLVRITRHRPTLGLVEVRT